MSGKSKDDFDLLINKAGSRTKCDTARPLIRIIKSY